METTLNLYQATQKIKRIGGNQVVAVSKRFKAGVGILAQALGVYLILVTAPMVVELGFYEDVGPIFGSRCSYGADCFQVIDTPGSFAGEHGQDLVIDDGDEGGSGGEALGEAVGENAHEKTDAKTGDQTAEQIDDGVGEKDCHAAAVLFLFFLGFTLGLIDPDDLRAYRQDQKTKGLI